MVLRRSLFISIIFLQKFYQKTSFFQDRTACPSTMLHLQNSFTFRYKMVSRWKMTLYFIISKYHGHTIVIVKSAYLLNRWCAPNWFHYHQLQFLLRPYNYLNEIGSAYTNSHCYWPFHRWPKYTRAHSDSTHPNEYSWTDSRTIVDDLMKAFETGRHSSQASDDNPSTSLMHSRHKSRG